MKKCCFAHELVTETVDFFKVKKVKLEPYATAACDLCAHLHFIDP